MTGRLGWNPAKTLFLVLATLPFVLPFVFLVGTALKPEGEFVNDSVGWPDHPTTANLRSAWSDAGLGAAIWHSVVATSVGIAVAVAISATGAFWFLQHGGRAATALRAVLIGTMALPPPVFIIPLFVLLSDHGLTSNLLVLGVVYGAWSSGFGLYLMYTYFRGLPSEIGEAARVDGASSWQLLRRVLLPLSGPAVATLAALTFLWAWSDLLLAVVLVRDPQSRTVTVAAALLSDEYGTNIPRSAAGVLIALLPMLVAFLFAQRYLARGIVAGVGK